MKIRYFLVDAFSTAPGSGNTAGVVLDAQSLNDKQMRDLVGKLGVNECVFVGDWEENAFSVRFFTPVREIDFAGHAAVALAITLVEQGWLKNNKNELFFKTPAGNIHVHLEKSADDRLRAVIREPAPRFRDIPPWTEIVKLIDFLGADERYLHRGLPMGVAFSGLWSFFLPFIAPGLVDRLEPNMEQLAKLCLSLDIETVHAYAPMGPRAYYARDFAPALGIPEDPVTGSANGALAALLARAGVVPRREGSAEIEVFQGHHLGVPGVVHVRVEYSVSGDPYAVYIGGHAVLADSGWVEV